MLKEDFLFRFEDQSFWVSKKLKFKNQQIKYLLAMFQEV